MVVNAYRRFCLNIPCIITWWFPYWPSY